MLRVGLLQKSAAGYRWTANEVDPGLLLLMEDVRITTATVGGPSEKLWYYRAGGEGLAVASYAERRPWEAAAVAAATFEVNIKPVEKGLSRANRARLVVA
jgi:predicted secreted protein